MLSESLHAESVVQESDAAFTNIAFVTTFFFFLKP